ncbi:DUF1972 domain-containing protein [Vibrio cholerae]|uniref:DUF1972 domain-containing protein n=1 Tax=Vibrio cholerae TaxID=666 RepID=UPI0006E4E0C5|nr:DUF1972 domain-containing protein [Vibrio cholerae]KQA30519.1 glycosyl transferase [Vibrio cholerae]PAR97488.1 glycosyltransferase family 1 protein [Vibrio cholerae]PAS20295.1 glycosyltransferase family 1 protein [Vibrio cholerae]HAS3155045.1 glycosyltransferase family 1 protein [Vibrio cholerae]
MKKVAVIGTVGIPACYGGFETLVENLTKYSSSGIEYYVFCSSDIYSEKLKTHNGARLIYIPLKANGFQSILYDIYSMIYCWFLRPDTVLILGVSGCLFLPVFKIFSKSKIITNIDGLEWKRDKWVTWAKKFLKWSEAIAVKFSNIVVTDNKAIGDYVEHEYARESITIAYGGDHALCDEEISTSKEQYALGLCRIEPENNVHLILEAFKNIDKKIKFVGNWQSSQFGKKLKEKYSSFPNIDLIDPVYELEQLYRLRRGCSFYVHGHSAGGTNPSLVEMMHFGVPIFAFDCSFNRYSTEEKAMYFSNSTELSKLVLNTKEEMLNNNGSSMLEIANRRYTWREISRLYESVY